MDISAVLTCHHEGVLIGPALASFREAIQLARNQGHTVESIVVVDRGDALTSMMVRTLPSSEFRVLQTDCGDPGQARNKAVAAAGGDFISFLDGDDLWGFNWLVESLRFAREQARPVICHSAVNVVFGSARQIWWHADSEGPDFDHGYLHIGNYWDAMCFAERRIMVEFPFRANNLADGFAHEDWHWNCVTLGNGIAHRPVPGTVHFKRRRKGSQMAKCDEQDVTTYPTDLLRFDWTPKLNEPLPSSQKPARKPSRKSR